MRAFALAVAGLLASTHAQAACPQALAVYSEIEGPTSVEFTPGDGGFFVANAFRLLVPEGPVLNGHVIWNNGMSRPNGALMLNCPDGDVTGDELRACTHWEGIVYAVFSDGAIGLIPGADDEAAETLLFADVSRALHYSKLNDGKAALPRFDAYALSGCQE